MKIGQIYLWKVALISGTFASFCSYEELREPAGQRIYTVKPLKLIPSSYYVKFNEESENDNQIENFAGRFEVFDIFH